MKNCFAYIRVSTVKQGQYGSSLQEQRDAIIAFAQRHDLAISEWFEDRETAAKKGRTQFMRMMAALEKRKAAGVILHKIDRGARNLWDWARIQGLIEIGIGVHFAHDNLDLKSRGGRLAADIQAVVAADYVRNLREEVRKGIRGRFKQGLYPLPAPVGYLNQGKAKPKVIDPVKGPLVRLAFELYASKRYSYNTLPTELHRRGLRSRSGKPISLCGMTTILRNPFYTGIILVKSTGESFQGVHEPLIGAKLFRTVQDVIDGRSNTKARRFDFTYRRLLTCGDCRYTLTGEQQKGRAYYRCHTQRCATKGIREDSVTARIKEALDPLQFSEQEISEMVPEFEKMDQTWAERQAKLLDSVRLRLSALEARERRLTDAYIDQAIEADAYNARKSSLLLELSETREEIGRAEHIDGDVTARAERFFELVRTVQLGPDSESLSKYRDAVEILTSNRTLTGKSLAVAMPSPFREMASEQPILFGAPHRSVFRTPKVRLKRSPLQDDVAVQRAQVIAKHLENWHPSGLAMRETPKRRTQPNWLKSKEGQEPKYRQSSHPR